MHVQRLVRSRRRRDRCRAGRQLGRPSRLPRFAARVLLLTLTFLVVAVGALTHQLLAGAGVGLLFLVVVVLRWRRRAALVPGPGGWWPPGGGPGGTAGVREPRRPHPSPPAGALALPVPVPDDGVAALA